MSVLDIPRLYFRGHISWDPVTTNNYPANYNEDTGWPNLDGLADQVKAFRQSAITQVGVDGNWNPDGTYRSVFHEVRVCGFDLGSGTETKDPVMSSTGKFAGMLVDAEPYGAFTSQLYFDSFQFGVDGGYRILGPRKWRFNDRYINFMRSYRPADKQGDQPIIAGIASVIWQTCFDKSDLRIDAFDSAALQALDQAMQDDDVLGLMVRFDTYRTIYFDDPDLVRSSTDAVAEAEKALIAKLKEGGFQPNPARSRLVGSIGLWRSGDSIHEPGDRALLSAFPSSAPPAGSAFAKLGAKSLTIDLGNSIPEVALDCTKQNYGDLTVSVTATAGGAKTTLGTLSYGRYDKAAYEATAGIVTLPLTADQATAAAAGDIQVTLPDGTPLLAETALRVIPDTPNLYLDAGASANATWQLYDRGVPCKRAMKVTVCTLNNGGGQIVSTCVKSTDGDGVLTLPIQASDGAVFGYLVYPGDGPPPQGGLNPGTIQTYTYMYVRVLAADADLDEVKPTWENVYARVLMNWNAIAPCMDNWLRLDDPVQVHRYGPMLKRLTDPSAFEDYRFMPVTRDMSAGERRLLWRFLDGPAPTMTAEALKSARPQPLPGPGRGNPADASRTLRQGYGGHGYGGHGKT